MTAQPIVVLRTAATEHNLRGDAGGVILTTDLDGDLTMTLRRFASLFYPTDSTIALKSPSLVYSAAITAGG